MPSVIVIRNMHACCKQQHQVAEAVLTRFVVVVHLHHGILYVGHFVISEEWKSDANLWLSNLQMEAKKYTQYEKNIPGQLDFSLLKMPFCWDLIWGDIDSMRALTEDADVNIKNTVSVFSRGFVSEMCPHNTACLQLRKLKLVFPISVLFWRKTALRIYWIRLNTFLNLTNKFKSQNFTQWSVWKYVLICSHEDIFNKIVEALSKSEMGACIVRLFVSIV